MSQAFLSDISTRLDDLRAEGLYKAERVIATPQRGVVALEGGEIAINLCANNYLGLSDNADLVATAQEALAAYGFGMSSVRFICGTQTPHKALEARIAVD